MKQKEYWNSVAYQKTFSTPFKLEIFKKYVPDSQRILDIGCGYGRTLSELYKNSYHNLSGIDISENMIKRAREINPSIKYQVISNTFIPFASGHFDSVILFAVLTCIATKRDQLNLLREIKRVLKPNGIIYVNDFLINNDERNLERYKKYSGEFESYGTFRIDDGAVLRHHSEEWVHSILSEFEKIIFEKTIFKTMNGNTSNGFYYFGRKLL